MKIILADDDLDLRTVFAALLRAVGYEVYEAQDGCEALNLQRVVCAELLITDMIMPRLDGLQTILAFREQFPNVRVIAFSAGGTIAGMGTLEAARSGGADATCQKGCNPRVLLDLIAEVAHLIPSLASAESA